ncbi:unnamed protein product [Rotaria sp. Silwood1]|nr:unnamed protein product [Rotaria sp. Silwood1]
MVVNRNQSYIPQDQRFSGFLNYISWITKKFTNILFIISIPIGIGLLYHTFFYTDFKLTIPSLPFERLKSVMETFNQPETTTETTTESITTEIITTTIITTTITPFEVIVDMDDQTPLYQLATRNGSKPFSGGARAKLLEILQLCNLCRKNTSITIVDVGAKLGEFGLYAAACNCSVYMFEKQPEMVALIQISIAVNEFTTPIYLYHQVIDTSESNNPVLSGSLNYNAKDLVAPTKIQNIQLDNIARPSSIFILKIDFDEFGLDVLRSGQNLFRQKRIRHIILQYNTVKNDQSTKQELMTYLRQTLRPKSTFIFRPNEEKFYGPLYHNQLKDLADQKNDQRPIIGLFLTFGLIMVQACPNVIDLSISTQLLLLAKIIDNPSLFSIFKRIKMIELVKNIIHFLPNSASKIVERFPSLNHIELPVFSFDYCISVIDVFLCYLKNLSYMKIKYHQDTLLDDPFSCYHLIAKHRQTFPDNIIDENKVVYNNTGEPIEIWLS